MKKQENNNNSLEIICNNTPALIIQIYEWIVRGNSEIYISETLEEHLPKEQIRSIIDTVYNQFFQLMKSDQTALMGWSLAAAQEVYRKMFSIGDFSGCLKAIKEIRAIAEKMDGSQTTKTPRLNNGENVPTAKTSPYDNMKTIPPLNLAAE